MSQPRVDSAGADKGRPTRIASHLRAAETELWSAAKEKSWHLTLM